MKTRKFARQFVCDFETTVYRGQTLTQVWAAAMVEMWTEDVKIYGSIDDMFKACLDMKENLILYFHNLKFDGSFWIYYLLDKLHYEQGLYVTSREPLSGHWLKDNMMPDKTFKYSISSKGQWYTITIKNGNKIIEIRDSLKLLPFSVERIGKSFGTKHKKLNMKYEGFRYPNCPITDAEKQYIANDVLVVKEALEIMLKQGHNKLTIGSCCLSEFKSFYDRHQYVKLFPDLYAYPIDKEVYGHANAGEYIKRSYKGGWCYLVKGQETKIKGAGFTADVNSLYPSMMHSISSNRYPVGLPHFWLGDIPSDAIADNKYYFVTIRTFFKLKPGFLPCIQIKGDFLYKANEWLETSDIKMIDGKYHRYYFDNAGMKETKVTLTLTMTDYKLIKEHYYLEECEILHGCWFYSQIGLFDEYINKYKEIKMNNKGAIRELAKLFLNNLYGKFAMSTDSSFKICYIKENGAIGYKVIHEEEKTPGYIAIGTAITSYARNFTIRAAQKNFHPAGHGFVYADTDSIHCDMPISEVKGLKIDSKEFCCWKIESEWDEAIFTRQKTYIERIVKEDGEEIEPYYNIKCAGMNDACKNLLDVSLRQTEHRKIEDMSEIEMELLKEGEKVDGFTLEEYEFLETEHTLDDFTTGLKIPGKLMPKQIIGGTLLTEGFYEMR